MASINRSETIAGIVVVEPKVWTDPRGVFVETFRQEWLPDDAAPMVQANRADRQADTLVGLHYHLHQADFWYVPFGSVMAALYDLRASSPTQGAALTVELGPEAHRGVYIPRGIAHGFYARTDATITYLVDQYYNPDDELGVAWDDPVLGINWPGAEPVLSERDRTNPRVADIPEHLRPE